MSKEVNNDDSNKQEEFDKAVEESIRIATEDIELMDFTMSEVESKKLRDKYEDKETVEEKKAKVKDMVCSKCDSKSYEVYDEDDMFIGVKCKKCGNTVSILKDESGFMS